MVVAREFSLENILKTTDIEFEMGNVTDLRITNCNSLEQVTIKGQNPQEVVIDNNANLKVIHLDVNPTYSLSICNMSNLEKIETPKKLNCHAIFKKINLQPEVKAKSIIVTRGAAGISIFEKDMERRDYAAKAVQVFDVTGAGDTVISTMTLGLASGMTMDEAAALANVAAGIVIGKRGTATVSAQEILEYLD